VEEAALLVTMQRVVGRIEIENAPARRRLMRLDEDVHKQPLDRGAVVADLMVARGSGRRVLEPVQRALAGERGAALAPGHELAGKRREHGIVAQLVVVDEIPVAERDPEHPLRDHGRDAVLDQHRRAPVVEAGGEPPHQPDRPIGGPEQQRPGIRGRVATIERRFDPAALHGCKPEQVSATLCRHRRAPLRQLKSL
jgi:hypothetical protein